MLFQPGPGIPLCAHNREPARWSSITAATTNFEPSRNAFPAPDIELHPDDAAKLGVKSGDMVTVTSTVGSLEIPVNVVQPNEILPGVVQITHGWREANVNIITHDDINDPINGFPLMKSVQVKIEKK